MSEANKIDSGSVDAVVVTLAQLFVTTVNAGVPADRIDTNASLEDELGMDSVALIELIAAIEAEFAFEFTDADLRTSTFESLRSLAVVVASRIQASAKT